MAIRTSDYGAGHTAEPIAIVGVGCMLPGNVRSADELYAALSQGRDCITEIPTDRWERELYYDPDPVAPGKTYVQHGGFVTDLDRFDAGFFDISAAEASRMDPQQRMLLQTVWHALENAGQSADELRQSNTGVFLAMMNTNDYAQLKRHFEGLPGITAYDAVGDAMSITAGRVAYFLGVEGPTFAVDTACSGSMVALHLARQSILAGDCDTAIVAGVSAILHPGIHIAFSKVGLMSRSGRCRAFDASADGYIRGEGCVAVLLRRQSEAIERGDHILASVVSTAVNQDGRTPALTAPNGRAQERVIRSALARAGISPTEIGYVEAHGTGTPVGDPIEMSALTNVYGPGRASDDPIYVGSAKTNFGHIESGAGLLGVVKAALALDHEEIPPSLHFTRLNPSIDLGQAPVRVAATNVPWPRNGRRRMAGVNSFGYSGTNAHTILQEAPLPETDDAFGLDDEPEPARSAELVVVSAKSAGSLQELVDRWTEHLRTDDATPLSDVAFTAAIGRTHLPHRLAVVGRTTEEIRTRLLSWREGRTPAGLVAGQAPPHRKPKVAFVFTGQGAQYAGMGRQLYESEQRFREAIDRCAAVMDDDLGTPLKEVLFGISSAELLGNTRYAQPGLFAIEYALADLLHSWGVEPDFVIGHSVGEIVAACVAGVLSLEDAARFVVARGRLMGGLPAGGKMLAVDSTVEQARLWIDGKEDDVSIATVNGPNAIVISGKGETIDEVAELVKAAGRRTRELEVSHAFHSPLMDPILDELTAVAATMRPTPARIPIVSNLTGDFMDDDVGGEYWSAHVRQAVLFHEGMRALVEARATVLVEIGPHPALTPAIANSFDSAKLRTITTLRRGQEDLSQVFGTLGSLFVEGVAVNLERLFWSPTYRRVPLPLYPFRRDRHWLRGERLLDLGQPTGELVDKPVEKAVEKPLAIASDLHPLLGKVASVGAHDVVFETTLTTSHPWTDHRVLGTTVFPGMAYLEMASRGFAAATGQDWRSVVLKDVTFERPLVLAYRKPKTVSLTLEDVSADGSGEATFVVAAAGEGGRERFCRGRITSATAEGERVSLATVLDPDKDSTLEIGPFYGALREAGLEYGSTFATVRELWLGKPDSGVAIGRITASQVDETAGADPYSNAVLLDGCLQVFGAALHAPEAGSFRGAYVPATIQSITLRRPLPAQVWSHVSVRTNGDGRAALATVRVLSDDGEPVAAIDGLELRRKASLAAAADGAPEAEEVVILRGESRDKLLEELRGLRHHQRVQVVTRWLANEVKDTMGQAAEALDLDNLDPSTAFLEIGLDSLLVTELQRRIQEKLGFRFQPMQGLDYQSIESLAGFILDEVLVDAAASNGATNGAMREAEAIAVPAR